MKDTIILYPTMGRGHLVPMVELGKFISKHHNTTLSIKILLPSPPNATTKEYIATVAAATTPSITFHHISQNLLTTLQSLISQSSKPKAFILDFFNHSTATITTTLNIPTFFYFPNSATTVALFLYTPTLHRNTAKKSNSFYNNALQNIPGLPPLSPEDMPDPMADRQSRNYESFVNMSSQMRKTQGIIVNSFENLETKAFRSLKNNEEQNPPVFCVGPLVSTSNEGSSSFDNDNDNGCLSWLNTQPSKSVVFLSFGSYGKFPKIQLREIAIGLEKSGERFLWVVRNPLGYESRKVSLDELLPTGFLERTKEKGMVVREWAPQVDILSHDSVGGFVTHCGWNSVLESVTCGVPMVAWPLYAEQKLNRVILVEEMKVASAMSELEDGFVSATELEERVREIMDSEKGRGKEVRERVLRAKNDGVAALSDGGSSRVALNGLVELWRQ